jgi:transposase
VSAPSIAPYYPFAGVQPVEQRLQGEGGRDALIRFRSTGRPVCSECGRRCCVHSYSRRRVRDLNLANVTIWLDIPRRKVRCRSCGVRVEAWTFVDSHRRYTKRFERAVAELCRVLPIEHVAEHFGLSWHTVKEIDQRRLEKEVGTPCYDGLRLLAIDEIAVRKRHRYMTIILDLDSGRIVWVGEDRSEATLSRFFGELNEGQKASIEAIAVDMSPPYWKGIKLGCPNAAIVYDFFHVVAKYGTEVLDVIRSQQVKRYTGTDREFVKGMRFVLLRNGRDLPRYQRQLLRDLLAVNEPLSIAYVLKEQLKKIWSYRKEGWAEQAILQWTALAFDSGIQPLIRFAKGLLRHVEGILNHCRYPIHTGRLEGINNKIKVMKRQAYGYRDNEYFKLKIKAAFTPALHLNQR